MCQPANADDDRSSTLIPPVRPQAPWRVRHVEAQPGHRLKVCFNDGTKGCVDLRGLIKSADAGVFAVLADESLFCKVSVEFGVVTWPGGLDLAPDAMYAAIRETGIWILE